MENVKFSVLISSMANINLYITHINESSLERQNYFKCTGVLKKRKLENCCLSLLKGMFDFDLPKLQHVTSVTHNALL